MATKQPVVFAHVRIQSLCRFWPAASGKGKLRAGRVVSQGWPPRALMLCSRHSSVVTPALQNLTRRVSGDNLITHSHECPHLYALGKCLANAMSRN